MSTTRIVVIKVGGSLLGWNEFPTRLRTYLDGSRGERIVLVVGGGRAVDWVRELDSVHGLGEPRSHALAVRALDLTASVVTTLVPGLAVVERPDELGEIWERRRIPVFSPRWFLETMDGRSSRPLAESWDVTTDSIAARLAVSLGADELRLLKSVGAVGSSSRAEAASSGLVDRAFPEESASLNRVLIVNLKDDPPSTVALRPTSGAR